jgi:hypothetical protein
MLKDGQGVTKDLEQAVGDFQRTSMYHNIEAQFNYAIWLMVGPGM